MEANLIKLTHKDLDFVVNIIEKTKQIFKEQGVDQWQNGYPNRSSIQNDIRDGSAYLIKDQEPIGYIALVSEPDPNYREIDGAWVSDEPYISVHRFVIAQEYRKRGYAKSVLKNLDLIVNELGCEGIRVDTHQNNKGMITLLESQGYTYCGVIQVADGARVAFAKYTLK